MNNSEVKRYINKELNVVPMIEKKISRFIGLSVVDREFSLGKNLTSYCKHLVEADEITEKEFWKLVKKKVDEKRKELRWQNSQ